MSTKLYEGLLLTEAKPDLFTLIPKLAKTVQKVYKRLSLKLVAEELGEALVDPAWRETRRPGATLIMEVETAWKKQQENYGSHHTFNDPLRFSIVFGRTKRGRVLAYPFYARPAYGKSLEKLGIFQEWGYWNNSDRPTEVAEEEWDERREEWDSLLDEEGSFGSLPFWKLDSGEPFLEVYLSSEELDINGKMSPEKRLQRLLQQEFLRKIHGDKETPNWGLIVESGRYTKDYLKSPAGLAIPRPQPFPEDTWRRTISELPPLDTLPEDAKKKFLDRVGKDF